MFATIQLVKSSQTPLYLQLANGLARFIENGQLSPGIKLPSIRSLAKELKINRDTVVAAYKILEQRGLAYGQTGSGTYVSTLATSNPLTSPAEPFSFSNKNLINFSTIALPSDHCPIEVFEGISSELILQEGWEGFYDHNGKKYQNLLKEICKYFKQKGLQTNPSQIRIVKDSSKVLELLPKFTNRPGICIESPCRNPSIFQQYGFKSFEIPLEPDGMDMLVLEETLKSQNIQYIYVTPYLQNPTGICYSYEKKLKLIALAKKYKAYIIEEDTYSDLLAGGLTYLPIYTCSQNKHVIHINNFSLLYLPKLFYSFVILPNQLKNIQINSLAYSFLDSIFHHYLCQGSWKQSQSMLIKHYKARYEKLLELINTYLLPYVSYYSCWGGIYIWLAINSPHITAKDLYDALLSHHILVSPGLLFYSDKCNHSYVRLSITQLNTCQMESGIKVIASFLHGKRLP